MQMTTTLAKLNAQALNLYDGGSTTEDWLSEFEALALAKLWHSYCTYREDEQGKLVEPAAYDDEVYNALDRLGYWDWV